MMRLKEMAFEPMAEFKKLTASLLTPTIKSVTAKMARVIRMKIYIVSMADQQLGNSKSQVGLYTIGCFN